MGIRVQFWLGASDGIKSHFLNSPINDFKLWFENNQYNLNIKHQREVYYLINYIDEFGEKYLVASTVYEAEIIDSMIDCFYRQYCDYGNPEFLKEADDSSLYYSRYYEHRHIIEDKCGLLGKKYWDYLLHGRGIGRDNDLLPYKSQDEVSNTSFLTIEEVLSFHSLLIKAFDFSSHEIINTNKYSDIISFYWALFNAMYYNVGLIITVG